MSLITKVRKPPVIQGMEFIAYGTCVVVSPHSSPPIHSFSLGVPC